MQPRLLVNVGEQKRDASVELNMPQLDKVDDKVHKAAVENRVAAEFKRLYGDAENLAKVPVHIQLKMERLVEYQMGLERKITFFKAVYRWILQEAARKLFVDKKGSKECVQFLKGLLGEHIGHADIVNDSILIFFERDRSVLDFESLLKSTIDKCVLNFSSDKFSRDFQKLIDATIRGFAFEEKEQEVDAYDIDDLSEKYNRLFKLIASKSKEEIDKLSIQSAEFGFVKYKKATIKMDRYPQFFVIESKTYLTLLPKVRDAEQECQNITRQLSSFNGTQNIFSLSPIGMPYGATRLSVVNSLRAKMVTTSDKDPQYLNPLLDPAVIVEERKWRERKFRK